MPTTLVKRGIGAWNSIWRVGLPPRSAASLTFAIACVGIATIVQSGLGLIGPDSAVFAPYYSATLVAALVGGCPSGIIAAILGALAAYWCFVPPEWGTTSFLVEQLVSLFLFALSSVVIIWAAESYRALLWRLRETERTRQLFNDELAHRIKNTLSSVQAIISQTLRDQPDVREKLSARIIALAATNDLLVKSEWQSASVREIVTNEISPYDASRFELVGDDVECPSSGESFGILPTIESTQIAAPMHRYSDSFGLATRNIHSARGSSKASTSDSANVLSLMRTFATTDTRLSCG